MSSEQWGSATSNHNHNLDFKNISKDHIDEFIKNCESEKEKGINIEKEILENEKKYFK